MHIYEYFSWLCRTKKLKESEGYELSEINKGTISKWRKDYNEGGNIEVSPKNAGRLSKGFNIPIKCIYEMTDEYGLSKIDWGLIGVTFRNERSLKGISIQDVSDFSGVHVADLEAFENESIPVSIDVLPVLCGAIRVDPAYVFSAWADKLWGEKKNAPGNDVISEDEHLKNIYDRWIQLTPAQRACVDAFVEGILSKS